MDPDRDWPTWVLTGIDQHNDGHRTIKTQWAWNHMRWGRWVGLKGSKCLSSGLWWKWHSVKYVWLVTWWWPWWWWWANVWRSSGACLSSDLFGCMGCDSSPLIRASWLFSEPDDDRSSKGPKISPESRIAVATIMYFAEDGWRLIERVYVFSEFTTASGFSLCSFFL